MGATAAGQPIEQKPGKTAVEAGSQPAAAGTVVATVAPPQATDVPPLTSDAPGALQDASIVQPDGSAPTAESPATSTGPTGNSSSTADQRQENRSKRKHERFPWRFKLTVYVVPSDMSARPRRLIATTADLSSGGCGMFVPEFLYTGTVLCIESEALPGRRRIFGVVRSCVHVQGKEHRVGVRFMSEEESAAVRTHHAALSAVAE